MIPDASQSLTAQADIISQDHITARCGPLQPDAVDQISRDDISFSGAGPADTVVLRPADNPDAVQRVGEGGAAGGVDADIIPGDGVRVGAGPIDENSRLVVPGNDVSIRRTAAADDICRGP